MSPGKEDSFQAWETLGLKLGHRMKAHPQFHSGLRAQAGADWAGGGILQKMATFKVSVLSLYFFIWLWGGCIKKKKKKKKHQRTALSWLERKDCVYKEQMVLRSY